MSKRKVMILNTSHNDLEMIKSLKKMDQYVIATGFTSGLIGEQYVDEYIQMDYSQKEEVLRLAREKEIDGICACCNDFGVITAAYVAREMHLPGHDTLDNIYRIHNKARFHQLADRLAIPVPRGNSFEDISLAKEYCDDLSYPIMVKAVDLSAGNGIRKVENKQEAMAAIDHSFEKSKKKEIIIEEYIEGTQHAICTFLKDQKVVSVVSNNEYSIINPYRVEIDTFPATDIKKVKEQLIAYVEKIAGELQLTDGIFHMQYRMRDGKPIIIEAMRRTLGNMYGVPARMVQDFAWEYWEARSHVGLPCEEIPHIRTTEGYSAYRTIMAHENGMIREIIIDDEIKSYIENSFFLKDVGDRIESYMSEPIGFLFMKFESAEQMQKIVLEQYDKVSVKIG